jgi:hypothetical protein
MGGINFNTGGGSSFDPANPGPIGGTTPSTGAFTRLTVVQGALTNPLSGIDLTATWNDAADTFRGLEITITDTASAAASTPLRIMGGAAGTATVFSVRSDGQVLLSNKAGNFGAILDGGYINGKLGVRPFSGIGVTNIAVLGCHAQGTGLIGFAPTSPDGNLDAFFTRGGVGIVQMGSNHATTATAQRIQAHGVGIGTGASLTLGGGSGDTKGDVILDGGNRSAYIASPSATEIRDILISHGLMAAS